MLPCNESSLLSLNESSVLPCSEPAVLPRNEPAELPRNEPAELPRNEKDSTLHQRMLQAHAAQDLNSLIALYSTAGKRMETRGDIDAACFYLTHAYVYALELDAPELTELQTRLAAYGRIHTP